MKKISLNVESDQNRFIPVLIVLFGALIVFGVTRMLNSERSYKDLVGELQSRTFGNRWVAAFELSKVLNSERVPPSEHPWLIENLIDVFKTTHDQRTQKFIVMALARIESPLSKDFFEETVFGKDESLKLFALIGLGDLAKKNPELELDYPQYKLLLMHKDFAIRQATIYLLVSLKRHEYSQLIASKLSDSSVIVQYAAAIGLLKWGNLAGIDTIDKILLNDGSEKNENNLSRNELDALKIVSLNIIKENKQYQFKRTLAKMAGTETNLKVLSVVKEVLKILEKE